MAKILRSTKYIEIIKRVWFLPFLQDVNRRPMPLKSISADCSSLTFANSFTSIFTRFRFTEPLEIKTLQNVNKMVDSLCVKSITGLSWRSLTFKLRNLLLMLSHRYVTDMVKPSSDCFSLETSNKSIKISLLLLSSS